MSLNLNKEHKDGKAWRAAIDIGSNSLRLLTCQVEAGKLINRKKVKRVCRLGGGVDSSKMLSSESMQAAVSALVDFRQIINHLGIENCPVFATSAVRDATNKTQFLKMVKQASGLEIEIISGQREAELGYQGVRKGLPKLSDIFLIDIGGGSTEIIIGETDKISFAHSFDIGAVRWTDKYNLTHSMDISRLEALRTDLYQQFKERQIKAKLKPNLTYVAIGGTALNLGACLQNLAEYDQSKVHNYSTSSRQIKQLSEYFCQASYQQKLERRPLEAKRAEIITAGSAILTFILEYIEAEDLLFSEYDNLEEAIFADL